jgi:UPF0176 protein
MRQSSPPPTAPPPSSRRCARHSAFYRFAHLEHPAAAAQQLRSLAQRLTGSIVVAHEGVNGTVAGTAEALSDFEEALGSGHALNGALRGTVFKRSSCRTLPFGRLKVSVKAEIVALELPQFEALPAPDAADDSHLSPQAWRELMAGGHAVLLDNRNHFEFRLGHFKGALDPQVQHFRDFVAYVQQQAPGWRAAGRPVAMYCTGGIRCDKTAPWLRSLDLQVLQLDGGVLNYFQQMPDAEREWAGECFVFDNRIALDTRLQETETRAEQVFDAAQPEEAWRLQRARQLDGGER